ncbi:MAG: macro domain-containing protein [Salegentibacter sp.]
MKIKYKNLELEAVQGNIANQPDVAAVVNAANAQLTTGGGVAGAIHEAAGPKLYEECRPKAPIKPGEAVITGAYNLPNQYVIHCLGPVYGRDQPEAELLADCYKNALKLCEENDIPSVAFPAISAGVFGYPLKEAAHVAFSTILAESSRLKQLQKVKFVLFNKADLEVFEKRLQELQ